MTKISIATYVAFSKAMKAGEGHSAAIEAAIAQDRLERPKSKVETLEESRRREREDEEAQQRAYTALEILKLDVISWSEMSPLRHAAMSTLMGALGVTVETEEETETESDLADVEAAPKPPSTPYPWPETDDAPEERLLSDPDVPKPALGNRDDMNMGAGLPSRA